MAAVLFHRGRQCQRGHGEECLPVDAEGFTTRRQDAEGGAAAQQAMGHVGSGGDEVLAVVEEQQELLRAQVVDDRVDRGLPGLLLDPQGAPDLGDEELRVAERRELDQPGAVAIAVEGIRGNLQFEARLAGATDTDQCDQATPHQQAPDLGQLPLASHERGDLGSEVGRVLGHRAERRELAAQPRRHDLVDMLGPVQVPQAMLAQVDELGPRHLVVGHERRGR